MENGRRRKRDIQARAYAFACRIVKLDAYLVRQKGTSRMIAAQLLRCGTSVGANLEEADAAQSKKDFISKCTIALKEARESHYWLRLLVDCNLVPLRRLALLITEAGELVAILTAIVKNARSAKAPS
jgi:four helix bundle protein